MHVLLLAVVLCLCAFRPSDAGPLSNATLGLRAPSSSPSVAQSAVAAMPAMLISFEDSDNLLLLDETGTLSLSTNEGRSWASLKSKVPDQISDVFVHPLAKDKRAFALTESKKHYYTSDAGLSWSPFTTELQLSLPGGGFSFHATEVDWILFKAVQLEKSEGWLDLVSEHTYYTKDSFKSSKQLLKYTADCAWAQSTKIASAPKEKIFCIQWPAEAQKSGGILKDPSTLKMVSSESYFPNGKGDSVSFPNSNGGAPLALGNAQSFLVTVVGGDDKKGYDLYSTVDGKTFSKAYFPTDASIKTRDSYTILDSSEHRLIVDLLPVLSKTDRTAPYGHLYISNSDGTYFTKSLGYLNRAQGRIDFERVSTDVTSGTLLANVIDNWKELELNPRKPKKVSSRISFDDGARWNLLRPPTTDVKGDSWTCKVGKESEPVDAKCALHFHSKSEFHNVGKVFSTLGAPGFLVGVGNVGESLVEYAKSDTFLSVDGGLTWVNAARGPYKYEIIDSGSIVVLVPDGTSDASKVLYNTKRGKPDSWKTLDVKVEGVKEWRAVATSIDSDSTSSKMIIVAESSVKKMFENPKYAVVQLDFSEVQTRKFGTSGKDVCVLGEDVGYYRRKADADCSVGRKFKHPEVKRTPCECDVDDYECDFNFKQDDKVDRAKELKCVQVGPALDQPSECPVGSQYKGSPGLRKIPGDNMDCKAGRGAGDNGGKGSGGGTTAPPKGGKPPVATLKTIPEKPDKVLYLKDSPTVLLLQNMGSQLYRSTDEGVTWTQPSFFAKKYPILLMGVHEIDYQRVFFLTEEAIFMTKDGIATDPVAIKTPTKFNQLQIQILDFHPTERDYLVFSWLNSGKPVETWATKCVWAWDSHFTDGSGLAKDAVFCSSFKDKNSKTSQEGLGNHGTSENPLQLVLITNQGRDRTVVIEKGDGSGTKLVVSSDGKTFVETEFPPGLEVEHDGFTVLESRTNGIFLDMGQSRNVGHEYGHLFKSNSNGTYYNRILENTNRNDRGIVDFEKMKGIPGVILANQSLISFDDGSTWSTLKAPETDSEGNSYSCDSDCTLNIYNKISGSVSGTLGSGKPSVHTSKHAAGIMVAVGSVGSHLDAYGDSNMFLTKDAGRTWTEIRKDAHKWAIGDHGAMIVMVNDEEATNKLIYSWNYGESWAEFQFVETPIRVSSVYSEPSATSLKFIITGSVDKKSEHSIITIDFAPVLPRTCGDPKKGGDFVEWTPAGDNGKDRCFLGKDTSFWRRKTDADCHIGREFEDMPDKTETCACTDIDFECDFHFYRDANNKCVPFTVDPLQPKDCKAGTSYMGSSGYRKIPLSQCKGGVDLSPKVQRTCGEVSTTPGNLKITTNLLKHGIVSYFYFNQTSSIMILDEVGLVYTSQDAGATWKRPAELKAEDYELIMLDPFRPDSRAYVMDEEGLLLWFTDDKGKTFKKITVPLRASKLAVEYLITHSTEKNYLIWIADKDCDGMVSPNCKTVAYVSTNHGGSWKEIANYVGKCSFALEPAFKKVSKDTILCQAYSVNSGNQKNMGQRTMRKLMRSTNLGGKWETALEFTINFATSSEYMVAAQLDTGASQMHMYSSLDAVTWTKGTFEDDDKIPDYGYTLLDASTGSAFIQVFASKDSGAEMGTLYKSIDPAGTQYKISLNNVNQDHNGFTDFEKLLGIPGIGMANTVINKDDVKTGRAKQVRSMITFNDGDLWKPLTPPKVDSEGKSYKCGKDCHLNLHHFTERSDANDLFSSASAVGFMMGVGNVGPYLTKRKDGNTFLTRDAGLTWVEVAKDAHLYEFGDQGGIIILANDEEAIDEIKFSLNHGKAFTSAKISPGLNGGKLHVTNIITEPYGASSVFVVFGRVSGGSNDKDTAAVRLDFTKVWPRECKFVKGDDEKSDYEAWNPTGEKVGDNHCMLGQQVQYYRRKSDKECHSKGFYEAPITLVKTCECTADDFTCDIGYSRNANNVCEINAGYTAPAPTCQNGQLKYTTGYVKIKNTKCVGGVTLDVGRVESCAVAISFMGWMGIFALVIGIPGAVSTAIINMKRGGRIRLPVDDETSEDVAARANDVVARAGYILKTSVIVIFGLIEIGLTKAKEGFDWARDAYYQRAGYAPVQANYHDLETDPTLLFDDE
ncbi:Oligoxyloglucan reducing end-specific cellobiohydrolase [Rhizoclosmatium globosum]|uniref:Oligoxyloglucan reducing end-specific cellobiohydrolase n=1 Tax=Rhizoclosmatium globosum TaxID=329046 RepID=A0A1Y2BNY8_9FUNG|nr:Oligoxyloglucan reducing end-specific cellobiohydrolase [Rhizoclosmatium globosum]|eukprot:ORY36459.1 Oligoxyloglucan reducing end-specific cellobiohydrolase [Rhizoclosmatium globosum]